MTRSQASSPSRFLSVYSPAFWIDSCVLSGSLRPTNRCRAYVSSAKKLIVHTAEKVWSKENAHALSSRRRRRNCALQSVPWQCFLRACAQGTLTQRMCREYRGSGQPASDGHPECINQSSGKTCLCCGRGIACVSCMIEDPGIPSQSLGRKTTKAGGRAEEGPLETLVSLTRCC